MGRVRAECQHDVLAPPPLDSFWLSEDPGGTLPGAGRLKQVSCGLAAAVKCSKIHVHMSSLKP